MNEDRKLQSSGEYEAADTLSVARIPEKHDCAFGSRVDRAGSICR